MKKIVLTNLIFIVLVLLFAGCNEEDDYILSVGEKNAELLFQVLSKNDIKFVDIYEYNWSNGNWYLVTENQSYCESGCEREQFYIDDTYFVLDATGDKIYNGEAPDHPSGIYYLNLEYLVYFDIRESEEDLDLYFSYPRK